MRFAPASCSRCGGGHLDGSRLTISESVYRGKIRPFGKTEKSLGGCSSIYLSWDAASWHISKKLFSHLDEVNQAIQDGFSIVKTAPLPAGAQFLNVIESVFSGMAKGIIHNSDYLSVKAAKDAIDRYFQERNDFFVSCPKRAGRTIWGQERVASTFSEANNCKDPLYR
jgi:hypothetical protein